METLKLENFLGREESLKQILRYSMYSPMFYRTNLWSHSLHVQWLMMEIVPFAKNVFGDQFDEEKAIAMAAVHDDHEIVMGDFQFGNKLLLSADQTEALHQSEIEAIETVANRFPEYVGPYRYRDLMRSYVYLECVEAEVLKFIDKFAAFGEALHELFAGNIAFATPVRTEFGCPPTPFSAYFEWLSSYAEKFPKMKLLTQTAFPLFAPIQQLNEIEVVQSHSPHTEESFRQPSGYHHYDVWKEIIFKHANTNQFGEIIVQKEFS
ncbi:MAG: YfbR-like 5'-deoxynucleotidase [Patescibacteria group bacterium]